MSTLRVTNLKGGSAGCAPNFPDGAVITGVATVGVLSATTFYGSGANLTGIDATALKDSGGSVKVQANSDGAVITGVLTATTGSFTGNISVGGTLTYEDVQNVDSIGIVTARGGVRVPNDTGTISLGTDGDFTIVHNGSSTKLTNTSGQIKIQNDAAIVFTNAAGSENTFSVAADGAVVAYYDNTKRFETTNHGTITTGIHTVTVGTDLDGYKVEEGNSDTSTALSGEFDFELENGHVQRYSTATG